ncbi:MAG: thioesterase family protein [Deltaproteobacteria bacterium]|nr:thioesterase family protein [Deltaproteobacteria bacterium]
MGNSIDGYPVVIEIPVVWGEMDAFQHVNNVVYFRYFENARIVYYEKLDVLDLMKRTTIGPILAATSCRFRMPLTYPDKVLIGAKVTNIEEDRFTMNHLAVSTRHQKVAAEGDAVVVAFNYRENKKAPIPDALRQRILDVEKTIF